MRIVETSGPVGCKSHKMPLAERMVQRPRHIVGQAFCPHLVIDSMLAAHRAIAFEILAHLGGTVMDFIGGTVDVFGSLPDIVVDSRKLRLAHPVGPQDPGAEPLWMVDHDVKRRPFDGNARSLDPDTQFGENIVDEALIAGIACQPVHDGINVWRRAHILLPGSDWIDDARYIVAPLDDVNGARRNVLARIGLSADCSRSGAGRRNGSVAPSPSINNPQLTIIIYSTLDSVSRDLARPADPQDPNATPLRKCEPIHESRD